MNIGQYKRIYLIVLCSVFLPIVLNASYFIENKGQYGKNTDFLFKGNGLNAWLGNANIVFEAYSNSELPSPDNKNNLLLRKRTHNFEMIFIDADFSTCETKNNKYPYFNYFLGRDSSSWYSNVRTHSEIIFKNVYKNIDLHFYTKNNSLRYDFIIHSGAKTDDIRIKFDYINDININKYNELSISTSLGLILHNNLFAYQETNSRIEQIDCHYYLNPDKTIGFVVGEYDKNKTLVIDPLIFSTYIGGSSYEYSEAIALDSNDNPVICGFTSSEKFPVTKGALDTVYNKNEFFYPDAFVSKFSNDGKTLLFSTFIGGSADDYAKDLILDANDNIYITGFTYLSIDFPVKNGYDMDHNGKYDSFITKLSSDGSQLIYSTFVGGSKDDYATAIYVDHQNQAYITGYSTFSGDYPLTADAFQTAHKGAYDAFIAQLSSDGGRLLYSTYIGGNADDFSQDIRVADDGRIYIAGITQSTDFPTTTNAYQRTLKDKTGTQTGSDCFITAIYPGAKQLALSTLLGGDDKDAAYSFVLDENANIFLTGQTASINFPVTKDAFNTNYHISDPDFGVGDIFVAKLDSKAEKLIFSTFIGGNASETAYEILHISPYIYLTGVTNSKDFPVTARAFDETYNDTNFRSDAFALRMSDDGSKLKYCTYIGGKNNDIARKIAQTKYGYSLITGTTSSTDFPVTKNAFQSSAGDACCTDAFLLKIMLESFYVDAGGGEDGIIFLCEGDSVIIGSDNTGAQGSTTFTWFPQTALSNPQSATPTAKPLVTTKYTFTVRDETGNFGMDTVLIIVLPAPDSKITGPARVMPNSSATYSCETKPGNNYQWFVRGGSIFNGANSSIAEVRWGNQSSGTISLIVCNNAGCCSYSELSVFVGDSNKPVISVYKGKIPFCIGDSVILDAGDGYSSYRWSNGTSSRFITIKSTGYYWVAGVRDGLTYYSDTIFVEAQEYPEAPEIVFYEEDHTIESTIKAHSYLWYVNNELIPNSNVRRYKPEITGKYRVEIFTEAGCSNRSGLIYVVVDDAVFDIDFQQRIFVFPNPVSDILTIELRNYGVLSAEITLFNSIGALILKTLPKTTSDGFIERIDLSQLPEGVYLLKISSGNSYSLKKIVIIR